MKIESEKLLERKLRERVHAAGGWCIKLVCTHITGLPDRLCLLPGGLVFFAEIKTTGKKPRPVQIKVMQKLTRLGFTVYLIDNSGQIERVGLT